MTASDDNNVEVGVGPESRTVTWNFFFTEAENQFISAGFESPQVDARRIVERASGFEGSEFYKGLKELATEKAVHHFDEMMQRRLTNEPLQYVCGVWGFRRLDLMVDNRVLIPRPETEIVAGIAIEELEKNTGTARKLVADLGTGSGAIGLSIAAETEDTEIILTDISLEALQVARANLAGLGMLGTRVEIRQGSWFEALPDKHRGSFTLIVSNPPYVSLSEADTLPADVKNWEPSQALVAGAQGTEFLEKIIDKAGEWLCESGSLVLEMAPHQTSEISQRMIERGYRKVQIFKDLTGRSRGVRGVWNS
ncbi:MAG: protein-(glutamine-N5) methyltransferase, release factor-specific [Acidimicrobiaceae bacterium]|nr:protein-(glutamine-N5) methyltransferase, release factor-specific [Acidimicrobiaceae bacterium]|tara:strand:- start:6333 stop:7259 length:927 start_codon:yes stop_codon:yes gene_type:complete